MKISYDLMQSILLLLIPVSLTPFILSDVGVLPKYVSVSLLIPAFILFFSRTRSFFIPSSRISLTMLAIIVIAIIFSSTEAIRVANIGYILDVINYIVILMVYVLILTIKDIKILAKFYVMLILTISVLSAVSAVLAGLGLVDPVVVATTGEGKPLYRVFLAYTNSVESYSGYSFVRPGGVFYETGALGIQILLALSVNRVAKFSIKNEYILIIAGFLTFSFAFFISMFFYIIFFYKFKDIVFSVLSVCFMLLIVSLFYSDSSLVESLYENFFSRFNIFNLDSSGFGNRIAQNSKSLQYIAESPFFGSLEFQVEGISSSIGGYFVKHGIFGGLIFLFPLFFLLVVSFLATYKGADLMIIGIPFLLLINLYHRPYPHRILYVIALFIIFELIRKSYIDISDSRNGVK